MTPRGKRRVLKGASHLPAAAAAERALDLRSPLGGVHNQQVHLRAHPLAESAKSLQPHQLKGSHC